MISQGCPTLTRSIFDSETSASTTSDLISAKSTTAPRVLPDDPNGATISPTSAYLVSTVPSNGARIYVFSSATCADLTLASADLTAAELLIYAASAFSKSACVDD